MSNNNWDKENLAKKAKETVNKASSFASGLNASKEKLAGNLKDVKENVAGNLNSAKHTIENNYQNAQNSSRGVAPKLSSGGRPYITLFALGVAGLFIWKFTEARNLKIKEREQLVKQKH